MNMSVIRCLTVATIFGAALLPANAAPTCTKVTQAPDATVAVDGTSPDVTYNLSAAHSSQDITSSLHIAGATTAWFDIIDGYSNLRNFDHLDVSVGGEGHVVLAARKSSAASGAAQVRIRIFLCDAR